MEAKKQPKVFVLAKIEMVLLLFFFLLMTVTSFIFGIRLGKKQAESFLGVTTEHAQESHLSVKSKLEEEAHVDSAAHETEVFKDHATEGSAHGPDVDEETLKKLQNEFQQINAQDVAKDVIASPQEVTTSEPQPEAAEATQAPPLAYENDPSLLKPDASFIGKFTIQLGAYRTMDEAKNFAKGFMTQGYKPLIKETDLPGKGTWYRVSLGVFESISSAKNYIQHEKNLFSNQQYVINEIK
jgi:cell division septation protein DedD